MKSIQSIAAIFFTTILSTGLVLGSFQMSFVEGNSKTNKVSDLNIIPTNTANVIEMDQAIEIKNSQTTPLIQVITQTPRPTQINTLAVCPPPDNWRPYSIQVGDTLASLADFFLVTKEEIRLANCLETDSLIPGSFVYLPQLEDTPTPTITATSETTELCGPPSNWVVYIIQSDDTLFELSILFAVSVPDLQMANCMGNSTLLKTGTRFYVPFYLPTSISNTATPTLLITTLPATLTPTRTIVNTVSPTNTPTIVNTNTVVTTTPIVPTNTSTAPAATATSIPPTSGPSNTPDPLNTPTLEPTPTKIP